MPNWHANEPIIKWGCLLNDFFTLFTFNLQQFVKHKAQAILLYVFTYSKNSIIRKTWFSYIFQLHVFAPRTKPIEHFLNLICSFPKITGVNKTLETIVIEKNLGAIIELWELVPYNHSPENNFKAKL